MSIERDIPLPWAAASPHSDATAAAEAVLAAGGNAVDGALAAATLLTVVYPNQCSAGGDLIALIGHPDGSVETVLGIGRSAAAMSRDLLSHETDQMPVEGALTVTVPGVVAAWHEMAARWGTGTLGDSLERAAA
ncbi:MAG: gamma-glutamyltransferase, partial [Aeromicrobium sp.]